MKRNLYPEKLQIFVPPVFQLENYQGAAKMPVARWYVNYRVRAKWPRTARGDFDSSGDGMYFGLYPVGYRVFDDPKVVMHVEHGPPQPMYRPVLSQFDVAMAMSHFSLFGAMDMARELSDARHNKEPFSIYMPDPSMQYLAWEPPYSLWALGRPKPNRADYYHRTAYAVIDILAPDDVLIEQFKVWLEEIRRAHGIRFLDKNKNERKKKKVDAFSNKSLEFWGQNLFLPMIDLVLWNRYQGREIRPSVLCKILYPNPRARPESNTLAKQRRTAFDLLTEETLDRLLTQASHEIGLCRWSKSRA